MAEERCSNHIDIPETRSACMLAFWPPWAMWVVLCLMILSGGVASMTLYKFTSALVKVPIIEKERINND